MFKTNTPATLEQNLINASEVAKILGCSRTTIDRLQLKGILKPTPTVHPFYYFDRDHVLEVKENLQSK